MLVTSVDDTLAEAKQQERELVGPARPPGNANKTIFDATKFDVDVARRRAIAQRVIPANNAV